MQKPLLIVDIQPAYFYAAEHMLQDTMNFIREHKGQVFCLFVGEGLTEDELHNVEYMFSEDYAIDIDKFTFIEKDYAWIRNEMEQGEEEITAKLQSGECDYAIDLLRELPNDMLIIGGGRNECLAEVEHTLEFMGKSSHRLEEYIY